MKPTALPAPAAETIPMIARGLRAGFADPGKPVRIDDAFAAVRLEWPRL